MKPLGLVQVAVYVTVALVIVGAFLIPFISNSSPSNNPEWQYDDYKTIDGVQSVSGALEFQTIGDIRYVHAKGTGSGTLTYSDGSSEDVLVHKARLDVFFMWGQSNAAMASYDADTAISPLPGTAYYFGTDSLAGLNSSWITNPPQYTNWSFYSSTDLEGKVRAGDKMGAFCNAYYEGTGHKVYWICGAVPGKSITTFHPTDGAVWEFGRGSLEKGIAAIDRNLFDYNVCYYMWIQGEADRAMPSYLYLDSYRYLHESIVDGKLGHKFHGGIISLLGPRNEARNQDFRTLANEIDGLYIGASAESFSMDNGLLANDNVHYTQAGDNIIGTELGEKAAELMNSLREDDSFRTILNIVPVLIILGLTVMVLGYIVFRR